MESLMARLCDKRVHKCIDLVIEKSENEELVDEMKKISSTIKTLITAQELYSKTKQYMTKYEHFVDDLLEERHIGTVELTEDKDENFLLGLLSYGDKLMMDTEDKNLLYSHIRELKADL